MVVNGVIVMKDQEPLKGVNPGQPIRFEPVKSKFEPLTEEGWQRPTMPPRLISAVGFLVVKFIDEHVF